ncbi:hypothetical protein PGTUg99_033879 [Puccinia graminis f. sp. tritici]|uniref:Uncharacterized protein n=1 Tax=Puccinia graminis f. sp. tritici TaxID=56615 RepID=A0A5B0SMI6_PUCGR|nr:hypothetical protein PGTUg99_033879 [Puccinia graminis f. sp. tritici]
MGLLASILCWSVLWQLWSAAAVSAGILIDLNKRPEEECSEGQLHLDTAIAAHHIEPIATGPSSFPIPSAIQIRAATKKRETYDGQEIDFSRGPRKYIDPTLAHSGYLDPSLSFADDDHQLKPDHHCTRIQSTTAPNHSMTTIPRIFEIDPQRSAAHITTGFPTSSDLFPESLREFVRGYLSQRNRRLLPALRQRCTAFHKKLRSLKYRTTGMVSHPGLPFAHFSSDQGSQARAVRVLVPHGGNAAQPTDVCHSLYKSLVVSIHYCLRKLRAPSPLLKEEGMLDWLDNQIFSPGQNLKPIFGHIKPPYPDQDDSSEWKLGYTQDKLIEYFSAGWADRNLVWEVASNLIHARLNS